MAIERLPPEVANRIAAGEVVERPASIVKELVENAIDAGARRIAVEIAAGGVALIRVRDDGGGLPRDELALAFERHATSKLRSASDLFAIATLGFRGEALPSIAAAAAEVEMTSRPLAEMAGAHVVLRDGAVASEGDRGAAAGTTVVVRDVFANQPARRAFLRSTASETRAVLSVVSNAALARPHVAFTLTADERTIFRSSGGGLRDAAVAVFGRQVAAALLDVDAGATAGHEPEGDAIAIEGLIGPPSQHRASRSGIVLIVNGRPIASRSLTYAVEEAYQGAMPRGRHPVALVLITIPPDAVDVNVHPTKAEVRFRNERAVFGAIQRAVRATLLDAAPPAAAFTQPWAGTPDAASWGEPPPHQSRLTWPDPRPAPPGRQTATGFPPLRAVGQIQELYIIAEGPDGLYLIDQHAAHERVMFEMFRSKRAAHCPEVQLMLTPATLDLSPAQALALATHGDALAALGFQIEPFGEGGVLVRAMPAELARRGDPATVLPPMLDALDDGRPAEDGDRAAATLACHASVRAGMTLAPEEQRVLIRQLEAAEQPRTCPHGRPTMIHFSADALGRGFSRR